MFNAVYKFKITDEGKWTADFDISFDQTVENPYDDREPPPVGRKGPFYAQDYSRLQSNTSKRARKLARPDWDIDEGRSGQDFTDLLNEELYLNSEVDFSFKNHYIGEGDWGNFNDYVVEVSSITTVVIPEKEAMKNNEVATISLSTIKRKRPIFPV
jgi:hypothetical protein